MELKKCVMIISLLLCKTIGVIDNGLKSIQCFPLPPEDLPVISAVLLECPNKLKNQELLDIELRRTRQIMVNIRVNPSFHVEKVEHFLILDELYDIKRRSKAKIMSPYLIEISRSEPVMMYPMEFSKFLKLKLNDQRSTQLIDDVIIIDKMGSPTKDSGNGHEMKALKQVNAGSSSISNNNKKKGNESAEVVNVSKKKHPQVNAGKEQNGSLLKMAKPSNIFGKKPMRRYKNIYAGETKNLPQNTSSSLLQLKICKDKNNSVLSKRCRHSNIFGRGSNDSVDVERRNDYHGEIPSKSSKYQRNKHNHNENILTGFKTNGNYCFRKLLRRHEDRKGNNTSFNDILKSDRILEGEPNLEACVNSEQKKSLKNLESYQAGYFKLPNEETLVENSKKSTSFIFHDLSLRSPLNYSEYKFNKYLLSDLKTRNVKEDERPCSSCGGKNKKPHNKTDSNVMRNNECICKEYHKECRCALKKFTRSVYDTWYSVYNMSAPLPFLTTKVRIFRKRGNIWFKTAPSIM